jgi:hypothetical protein
VGAVAILAAVATYVVFKAGQGEHPPSGSPYVGDARLTPGSFAGPPLLLVIPERSANPLRAYLSEILLTEGLNAFDAASAAQVDWAALDRHPMIILAEGLIDDDQALQLDEYVQRGGRLIVMKPAPRLAGLCGLEPAEAELDGGYVLQDAVVGGSLPATTSQFHGSANRFRVVEAEPIAWLSADGRAPSVYPAITRRRVGRGWAAAWAYDLARSVALTRQGDPNKAGQERDGDPGLRAQDAFVGWIDLDRISRPQADEQMRLFSGLVAQLLGDELPLPRLWYFPGGADSLLVATGDAHGSSAAAIEDILSRVERHGGRMSVYYAPTPGSDARRVLRRARGWLSDVPVLGDAVRRANVPPTPARVNGWRARGHEFGLHPSVDAGLEAGWDEAWRHFTGLGFGPVPPTVRTHAVAWQGWVQTAHAQAAMGIRLNLDYYHSGRAFRKPDGTWAHGYATGSGLPMRFVDEQGRLLDLYQLATQLVDEHLMPVPWNLGLADYSVEDALEVSRTMLASGAAGVPSAFCAQFHVDPFALGGEWRDRFGRWLDGTLQEAARLGYPIWPADRWLRFVVTRNSARFEGLRWDPESRELAFTLDAPGAADQPLAVLVPARAGSLALDGAFVDGEGVMLRPRALSGIEWRSVDVAAGRHTVRAMYK